MCYWEENKSWNSLSSNGLLVNNPLILKNPIELSHWLIWKQWKLLATNNFPSLCLYLIRFRGTYLKKLGRFNEFLKWKFFSKFEKILITNNTKKSKKKRYPYGDSPSSSLSTSASHNTSASVDYSNQPFRRNQFNSSSSNQHHSIATTSSNNRAITSASVNPEYLSRA